MLPMKTTGLIVAQPVLIITGNAISKTFFHEILSIGAGTRRLYIYSNELAAAPPTAKVNQNNVTVKQRSRR
jgi:hypothetical protein